MYTELFTFRPHIWKLITGATLVLMLILDTTKFKFLNHNFGTMFALCWNWLFTCLCYTTIRLVYGSFKQTFSNTQSLSFKIFSKASTRILFYSLFFAEGTYAAPPPNKDELATTNDYYDSVSLMYVTIMTVFLEIFYRHKNRYVASVDDFLFYVSASVFTLVHLIRYSCWHWTKLFGIPYLAIYITAFFAVKGPSIGLHSTAGLCIFQLVSCLWLGVWWWYRRGHANETIPSIFIVSFNYDETNALFAKMLVATMSLAIIRPFSYVYQSFGNDIKRHRDRALVYHQMKDDINLLRKDKQQHDTIEDLKNVLEILTKEHAKVNSDVNKILTKLFEALEEARGAAAQR
ncbi:6695_t:CDS:2 [Paraglomus brasilianum]|uniref:6695_t:CDS:1 n=1 Tax=Paraglomus brasilianum TaxID=144538 RepID=A0A9N8W5V5_9GLOM|nr:6695_t:CDS:2 [Paraglomus brasilianum]